MTVRFCKVLARHSRRDVSRSFQAEFPALQVQTVPEVTGVPEDLSDVDVLLCSASRCSDYLFARTPQLKWIQSLATGVDHFLRCPSLKPDVLITSGRGIHGPTMRETVLYMMMAISRDGIVKVEDKKAHFWERQFWSTLHGKTAMIVGVGIVGIAIAQLLKALGMRIVGVTRTPRNVECFDAMVPADHLLDAVGSADYVINVLPASADNIGLFDGTIFAAMKPSATTSAPAAARPSMRRR